MRKPIFLALLLTLWLSPLTASAQTKAQKEAATEAFRACREMEEYGDATPCWRRWLEKHKQYGNDAEVLVAEERVGVKKPPPKEEPADQESPPVEPPEEETEEPPADEEPPPEEPEDDDSSEETARSEVELRRDDPFARTDPEERGNGFGLHLHLVGGITIGAQEHFSPFLVNTDGDLDTDEALRFKIPSLLYGGGGAVSYDLTPFLPWPGLSVRAGGDFLVGEGASTQAQVIATELLLEQKLPLHTIIDVYAGLGGTFSLIRLKSVPLFNPVPVVRDAGTVDIFGQIVEMSGTRLGAVGLVGAEFPITPTIGIRLEGTFRYLIAKQSYESPNPSVAECPEDPFDLSNSTVTLRDSLSCWGFDQRKDSWNNATVRLGAVMRF